MNKYTTMFPSCHVYWISDGKHAHVTLVSYPLGPRIIVVGPGSGFGALGFGLVCVGKVFELICFEEYKVITESNDVIISLLFSF